MDFDHRAKEWDSDPVKIERAKAFAENIAAHIQPGPEWKAMEFGCGTGQVSFFLKDFFYRIILVDNSQGMIEVLREKIGNQKINKMQPYLMDVFRDALPEKNLDVIYTLMTLHHIPELEKALDIFHDAIAPEGYLCIGDLVKEDGSFHNFAPDFRGHHGFSREYLKGLLEKKGFREISHEIFFEIEKKEEGKSRKYPVFNMIAQKKTAQKQ